MSGRRARAERNRRAVKHARQARQVDRIDAAIRARMFAPVREAEARRLRQHPMDGPVFAGAYVDLARRINQPAATRAAGGADGGIGPPMADTQAAAGRVVGEVDIP